MTVDETLLSSLRAELPEFAAQSQPVLKDFFGRLDLLALFDASAASALSPLDHWLRDQRIEEEDRVWLLTRIGYFIGEYIIQRFGGRWVLCEDSQRRSYARFVIGDISGAPGYLIDAFEAASYLCSQPPPRRLAAIVTEIETELPVAGG